MSSSGLSAPRSGSKHDRPGAEQDRVQREEDVDPALLSLAVRPSKESKVVTESARAHSHCSERRYRHSSFDFLTVEFWFYKCCCSILKVLDCS